MRPRPLRFGITWLLALVMMRSLVPAGFMPAWVDGALAMVVCDGHAWSANDPRGAHQHLHHHGGDAHSDVLRGAGDDCSYAQSASPALVLNIDLNPADMGVLSWTAALNHAGIAASEPFRYSSARGPPSHA